MERPIKKKKSILKISIIIILVLLILYTAAIYIAVSAALVPSFMRKLEIFEEISERCYGEQVQSEEIKQNLKNGSGLYKQWLKEKKVHEISQLTEDGYNLKASVVEGDPTSHIWVLMLHGYTGWKETMYPYAMYYNKRGCHVLIPDLRTQGESQGDFIGMGWTDQFDCRLFLDRILEKDPDASVIIHGLSMGAATALMMSSQDDLPDQVKFIVSESSYTDAYSMFGDKAGEWFHLPSFPVVDSMRLMLLARGGYDLNKACPLDAVKHSHIPTLFIHGDQDRMISVDHARKLYEAASCEKELLIIEGAGHAQTQAKAPSKYNGAIGRFMLKYIPDRDNH